MSRIPVARLSSRRSPLITCAVALLLSLGACAAAEAAPPRSVLVVPFRVSGGDDGRLDWLGDAVARELVAESSRRRAGVRVTLGETPRPAPAPERAAEGEVDPAAELARAARDAGADAAVSGEVQVVGDRLRIRGNVVGADGRSLGTLKADGALRDLFELEDALSAQLAELLDERDAAAEPPPPAVVVEDDPYPLREPVYYERPEPYYYYPEYRSYYPYYSYYPAYSYYFGLGFGHHYHHKHHHHDHHGHDKHGHRDHDKHGHHDGDRHGSKSHFSSGVHHGTGTHASRSTAPRTTSRQFSGRVSSGSRSDSHVSSRFHRGSSTPSVRQFSGTGPSVRGPSIRGSSMRSPSIRSSSGGGRSFSTGRSHVGGSSRGIAPAGRGHR